MEILILERYKVACAASGKAGGFLASSWCSHSTPIDELARTSFKIHQELAEQLNGEEMYEFRMLHTYSANLDLSVSSVEGHTYSLPEDTPVSVIRIDE